jgi:hypothetical protein
MGRGPGIVAGQVHVLPGRGPDVRKELVGHVLVSVAQVLHPMPEVAGVPGDDGGDQQVEPARPMRLILERAVADLAQTVEEHGPGELVAGLALVEPALDEVTALLAPQELRCKVKSVRSIRPISASAAARAFCRG